MKTKSILLAFGSSLLLAAPAVLAQNNVATNNSAASATNSQTRNYQKAAVGERSLLPEGVKEKLDLTQEQKTELKPIEDDFAKTSGEYQKANQPRIDAAHEASRQARASKDTPQIQAARKQLQEVWAGLQPYRVTAVNRIKPLLTPDQLKVLENPKNQWREIRAVEANDPSAK